MNIHLQDVILTSSTGDKFYKLKECYIKGSSIKYVRMGDEVMQAAMESNKRHAARLDRERKEREKLQAGDGARPPKKFQKTVHPKSK